MIGNIFKHCCLTSFVILVAYFLNLAIYMDYLNSNLVPIGKGNCTQITNSEPAVGPEDLTLYDDDILLTGSDYRLELFLWRRYYRKEITASYYDFEKNKPI